MTRDEAIQAARLAAEWQGWRWYEPVRATRKRPIFSRHTLWDVRTGCVRKRCDFQIIIDDETGKVTEKHYYPR